MAEYSFRRKKDGSIDCWNASSTIRTNGNGRIEIFFAGRTLARPGPGNLLQSFMPDVSVRAPLF